MKTSFVDLDNFRMVIETLDLDNGFYYVAEKVLHKDRVKFETKLSESVNKTKFIVNQFDLSIVEQDFYWPVVFHPLDTLLGVDMLSNPILKETLDESLISKRISYSDPVIAVDTKDISIFKVFPVSKTVNIIVGLSLIHI